MYAKTLPATLQPAIHINFPNLYTYIATSHKLEKPPPSLKANFCKGLTVYNKIKIDVSKSD